MVVLMNNNDESCYTFRACLGISGMKGNEGHWGGGISTISQNSQNPLQSSPIHLNPPFPKQALMLYLWMFNTRPYVQSEHGEPPRTTVQPQELYGSGLGRVIREVFVWSLLA
jgi:hypothetical protein